MRCCWEAFGLTILWQPGYEYWQHWTFSHSQVVTFSLAQKPAAPHETALICGQPSELLSFMVGKYITKLPWPISLPPGVMGLTMKLHGTWNRELRKLAVSVMNPMRPSLRTPWEKEWSASAWPWLLWSSPSLSSFSSHFGKYSHNWSQSLLRYANQGAFKYYIRTVYFM